MCSLPSGQTQKVTVNTTGAHTLTSSMSKTQILELMADEALYARKHWSALEILILFFMCIALPVLAVSPDNQDLGPLNIFRALNQTIFPFPYSTTIILVGAWAIHFAEGISALVVAKKLGLKAKQSNSWFWWTCLLGFPCFRWLMMLRDCNSKAKQGGKDTSL